MVTVTDISTVTVLCDSASNSQNCDIAVLMATDAHYHEPPYTIATPCPASPPEGFGVWGPNSRLEL